MAVYTPLSDDDVKHLLSHYDIGEHVSHDGIESGVENTNFRLKTSKGHFILTIYEKRVDKEALPFYLNLQHHLAASSIPCPLPVANKQGEMIQTVKGKPTAIVSFLNGKSAHQIQNFHLPLLGEVTARMHLEAKSLVTQSNVNSFSLAYWQKTVASLDKETNKIKSGLREEITSQLEWIASHWPLDLPSGVIHGDLFPDNVFFENNHLSGVIDFYFACNDAWMYDLAIILNAWCFEGEREFNLTKARLLLSAYDAVRPITKKEWQALPVLASGAAMRFLLTRIHDWCNPVSGAVVKPKDPLEYLHKLRFHHGISSYKEYGV